ncbi:DNA cytosine methyltransferase [Catenovulum agarivorans]|uniref:DNA cytosine methyltransferase n=1 Tax=Catenovulum agarivorans TaxID=1172192 RepID=UPI0002E2222B|nr:DNA cytosine methyltransferase [Catenovulum agarivorans]
MNRLILSTFSGIDLFGRGFENKGFCVVRAPEKFLGGDIRDFHPPSGFCDGVIGGSPCQDFSRLNRNPKNYSHEMLDEFIRVVEQANPQWFLHENVVGVPEFEIAGYQMQRFELDLSWFNPNASRRRIFTFGWKCDAPGLNPMIKTRGSVTHQAITTKSDLSIAQMADIQGCDFADQLEHFTVKGKKTVIGNAVPLPMAEYLADLINESIYGVTKPVQKTVTHRVKESVTSRLQQNVTAPGIKNVTSRAQKVCACGCGRLVVGRQKYAHQNCRKKASRRRAV